MMAKRGAFRSWLWLGVLWFLCLGFVVPGAALAGDSELEKATIVLQWLPQAQFVGYFVAQDKGFYKEEGVSMRILPGGPDVLVSEYLESRRAEYGSMFLVSGLEKRSKGLNIVHVAQLVQKSALLLVVKKSSSIEKVEDLDGKRVGLWHNEFQLQARALFKRLGIKVTIVPQSSSMDLFIMGGVDAVSAMWYNELHTLYDSGLNPDELVVFHYDDPEINLNFPEDGLFCLEETYRNHPEKTKGVVKATLRGWEYAFAHQEEALSILEKYMKLANVPFSYEHQRWMLERMRDIVVPDEGQTMGVLSQKDYDQVGKALMEAGFVKKVPSYEDFTREVAHD